MCQPSEGDKSRALQQEQQRIDFENLQKLTGINQAFTSGENALTRSQEDKTLAKNQAFTGKENEATRALQSLMQQNEFGQQSKENQANRAQELGILDKQQEFTKGENSEDRAFKTALQQLVGSQEQGLQEGSQKFQADQSEIKRNDYLDAIKRATGASDQGEQQLLDETNAPSQYLGDYEKQIRAGATPAQQEALKQVRLNLAQNGVRGSQAASISNREAGKMEQNLETDLAQKKLEDEQQRRAARQNYFGQKAVAGKAASYQYS